MSPTTQNSVPHSQPFETTKNLREFSSAVRDGRKTRPPVHNVLKIKIEGRTSGRSNSFHQRHAATRPAVVFFNGTVELIGLTIYLKAERRQRAEAQLSGLLSPAARTYTNWTIQRPHMAASIKAIQRPFARGWSLTVGSVTRYTIRQ